MPEPSAGASWSPSDNYLLVDYGGEPDGRGLYIVTTQGRSIGSIGYGGDFYWANNTQLAFDETTEFPFGDTDGHISNLALVNVTTGRVTDLFNGNASTDYSVVAAGQGKIYYQKSVVASPVDWDNSPASNTADTYWVVGTDGRNPLSSTVKNSPTDPWTESQLDAKIFSLLPQTYKNENGSQVDDVIKEPGSDLAVFHLYQDSYNTITYQDIKREDDIATINLSDPSSFKIIATGDSPTWAY